MTNYASRHYTALPLNNLSPVVIQQMTGLFYASPIMLKLKMDSNDLCWTRKRWGKGFRYINENGLAIKAPRLLKRLRKLAIPPMWKDVQICRTGLSKIQATGRDLKGRKQYIYHPDWSSQRQQEKFRRLRRFGKELPAIREHAMEKLKLKGWPREKVLSLMIMVLDETGIRIGNRQYLDRNNTYGLSTLRRRHLDHEDEAIVFHYKGKSNKNREVVIEDETLMRFIRKAAEQPGYEIFRYKTADGWESVDSDEINAYIHTHLGEEYSSKYFRTWAANRLLIESHAEAMKIKEEQPRKSKEKILVRLVADGLGNTPAVCKSHYLHPGVLKRAVRANDLSVGPHEGLLTDHSKSEKLLLSMMRG